MAEYNPVTAQDAIADFGPLPLDEKEAEYRAANGGQSQAYRDYETALENYEGREDMESRKERLARLSINADVISPVEEPPAG